MFMLIIDVALTLGSKLAQALLNLITAYIFNVEEYWLKLKDNLVEVNARLAYYSFSLDSASISTALLSFLLAQWWFVYNFIDFIAYNISVTWHNLYGALRETWYDISCRYYFSEYAIYRAIYNTVSRILTFFLQGPLPPLIAVGVRFLLPRLLALLLLWPASSMYLLYPASGRYVLIQLLIIYDFVLILMVVYNALAQAIPRGKT